MARIAWTAAAWRDLRAVFDQWTSFDQRFRAGVVVAVLVVP